MTRLRTVDIDPVDPDPDGLSDGVSSAVVQILLTGALTTGADLDGLADGNSSAGAAVTLDGALTGGGVYTDITGSPRHIHILDLGADNQTGATYTVTGLDASGGLLIEAIAGPAASGFILTANRFSRVDTIAIASPAAGSTVDIGVNGVFISADGLAHRLNIIDTGADDQTTATYTVTGLSEAGLAQTEAIVGPDSGLTVTSAKYFQEVTSITIASPVATSTIDLGTVDEVQTKVFPLNNYNQIGATIFGDVSGTIDFTVQETFNRMDEIDPAANATFIDIAALADKTADTVGTAKAGATAVRFTINSYSTGAEFQGRISQSVN